MIKKTNIHGDEGYYHKQQSLVVLFDVGIKIYNVDSSNDFRLIYRSEAIREPSCVCYGKLNRIFWIATTENRVYGVKIDENKVACDFKIRRVDGISDFEITSIGISNDEKWLFFGAISSQGDIMFTYNINNGNVVTLDIGVEISIPFPLIKYRGDCIAVYKKSNLSFDYRDKLLLKKEVSNHSLDSEVNIRLEIIKLNPYWNRKLRDLLQISDDGRYFLCEKKGTRYDRTIVIDAETEQIMSGDALPEAICACYDAEKNRFIAANSNEVFSASLNNKKVGYHRIFDFKETTIRNLILMNNHLLVLMDKNSYLLDVRGKQ